MFKQRKPVKSNLTGVPNKKGETIEAKVRRIVNNKEPITDGAPLLYTDRKDGVNPDMNPRTDRWEHAIEAMDKVTKSHRAKRDHRHKTLGEEAKDNMKKEQGTENPGETGGQSTQGTK